MIIHTISSQHRGRDIWSCQYRPALACCLHVFGCLLCLMLCSLFVICPILCFPEWQQVFFNVNRFLMCSVVCWQVHRHHLGLSWPDGETLLGTRPVLVQVDGTVDEYISSKDLFTSFLALNGRYFSRLQDIQFDAQIQSDWAEKESVTLQLMCLQIQDLAICQSS